MKKIHLIYFVFAFVLSLFNFCVAQNIPLMGMTYGGGAHSCGTIFKMNGDGSGFQTVYSFDSLTGINPYGTLLQANDGKLYGMAYQGGAHHEGVIFSFDPVTYVYNDVFDFTIADGAFPYGSLIQATNGNLYGMTSAGGNMADGVLFSFNPADSGYTKLVDLSDSLGAIPKGDLIQAGNGKLYGMTSGGSGQAFYGVLFSFDPVSNKYSTLIDFNLINGTNPYGSLIEGGNGWLYGTTRYGGANSAGVLFSFNPADSSYSKLLDFAGGNKKYPSSSLLMANNRKLYGMTWQGGLNNVGSVFSFDTTGSIYSDVQDFDTANGSSPFFNTLMQASNNTLYGMTVFGGVNNDGALFSFNPDDSTYTKLVDFNGANGKYPNGTLLELQVPTGILNERDKTHLTIYPNPAENQLTIHDSQFTIGKCAPCIMHGEIYNVFGEVLYQSQINNLFFEINVSGLASGIYFVKVADKSGGWQNTGRFVKE